MRAVPNTILTVCSAAGICKCHHACSVWMERGACFAGRLFVQLFTPKQALFQFIWTRPATSLALAVPPILAHLGRAAGRRGSGCQFSWLVSLPWLCWQAGGHSHLESGQQKAQTVEEAAGAGRDWLSGFQSASTVLRNSVFRGTLCALPLHRLKFSRETVALVSLCLLSWEH